MTKDVKQLSNPYSTGGGGIHFENNVQASFVVLMLTEGFAPCLPNWPINKIKLQGRYQGFNIDDLIVYTQKSGTDDQAKLLAQIKHSISITNSDKELGKVIQAAWDDFRNKDVFTENIDLMVLITGPLSATDTGAVRTLLKQAEHAEDSNDFISRIELTYFSSDDQRKKLKVFKTHLKAANDGIDLTNDELWRFLKSFRLLIYDLDIKGVILSLLHTLIGQSSQNNPQALWAQICEIVKHENENAGCITLDSIPKGIRSAFQRKPPETIPDGLIASTLPTELDWNQNSHAKELAITNLIGSWNENFNADIDVIKKLAGEDYSTWIKKIQKVLLQQSSPIILKNGIWSVSERLKFWQTLGPQLFDNNLDDFKQIAITVLTEPDPKFDLPHEKRYSASLYGKTLKYSTGLRKGLAETLALFGSHSKTLTNCSVNKPETMTILIVREIFENADWKLWGNLNYLLSLLAEAAPNEFLKAVETALAQNPCPFDELFSQESTSGFGENYLTGLLWALETLAWDEEFLVRVTVILSELASHDPGGNWANRPSNSLKTIFLPWLPQTLATVEKRQVAVQALQREAPELAWKLLLSLLPNQSQISSGSCKPIWRQTIPEDRKVTDREYWDQVSSYADLVVQMAKQDIGKLNEVIKHLDNLPQPFFENLLTYLSSKEIVSKSENERLGIWEQLTKLVARHKCYADAKWALSSDIVLKIENTAKALEPKNPFNRSRILFVREIDFEEKGNWQNQEKILEERRNVAIKEIFDLGGIQGVIEFAINVERSFDVGFSLGVIPSLDVDSQILPALLNSDNLNLSQFARGFIAMRYERQGWPWVDNIDKKEWSSFYIGQFLSCLPFTMETWKRANILLGNDEEEYWNKVYVNPYQARCDFTLAIDKLIEYGRPHAAISCLDKILYDKQPLDKTRAVKALLSAISSPEPSYALKTYHIVNLIKALQDDPETNPDDLFRVEWAYLSLLDEYNSAAPKSLEKKLASDAGFFCELIRIIYRSKKTAKPKKEPTEQEKNIATNAYSLLNDWRTPPGLQSDGSFLGEKFEQWFKDIKKECTESGHLEVAFSHVGHVFIHSPSDPDGLWIHRTIAEALNAKDAEDLRGGFRTALYNSRGAHFVDPAGKPEKELAAKYRKQADAIENAGYHRFATTLKGLADSYSKEAERIISKNQS